MQLKVFCNNHISKKILHFRFEYSNIQRTSLILFGMNFKKLCYLFTLILSSYLPHKGFFSLVGQLLNSIDSSIKRLLGVGRGTEYVERI